MRECFEYFCYKLNKKINMIEIYYCRDYVQVKHLNRCCNSHQVNNLVGIFIKNDIVTWKK